MAGKIQKRADIEKIIADSLLKSFEKDIVPWRKPWSGGGCPTNLVSNKEYQGSNSLLLGMSAIGRKYDSKYWLTWKQLKKYGGKLKEGEWNNATPIIKLLFFNPETREVLDGFQFQQMREEKTAKIKLIVDEDERAEASAKLRSELQGFKRLLKLAYVFNASQCVGIKHVRRIKAEAESVENNKDERLDNAEALLKQCKDTICPYDEEGGLRAYYNCSSDSIHLPKYEKFVSAAEFYMTAFHEYGHATGHESRLNRKTMAGNIFGTPEEQSIYAREEIVAEVTAFLIGNDLGILHDIDYSAQDEAHGINSREYLKNWARHIRNDPGLVLDGVRNAFKAATLIQNGERLAVVEEQAQSKGQSDSEELIEEEYEVEEMPEDLAALFGGQSHETPKVEKPAIKAVVPTATPKARAQAKRVVGL